MAGLESPSPVPRSEYVESVLNSHEKKVEARANFSRQFLTDKGIDAEGFKKLLAGVKVPLAPDFDFQNDRALTRAILDLQEKLKFPQVNRSEGQDGIFGNKTFNATKQVLEAERQTTTGLNFLRDQVNAPVQSGFTEALNEADGERWVGKLRGNGNREVGIFIPRGTDPSKPFEVIYHFHGVTGDQIGLDAEKSTGRNRLEQVLQAAQNMGQKGKNIVVVYPLSAGHRAKPGQKLPGLVYDADWMRKGNASGDDMDMLHAEVLSTIQTQFGHTIEVGSITAKGHSAGGTPLVNIAEAGFRLDRIDFLDASYGGRIAWIYPEAIRNNPNVELNIFLKPKTKTDNRTTRSFEGKPGVQIIESRISHGLMNQTYFDWKRP